MAIIYLIPLLVTYNGGLSSVQIKDIKTNVFKRSCAWKDTEFLKTLFSALVLLGISLTILCIVGFFGIIWTIYVIIKIKSKLVVDIRKYLLTIFVSDFLFDILCLILGGILFNAYFFNEEITFGPLLCKVMM